MKKLLVLLALFPVISFGQIAVKGSLWENGAESECNWYFSGNLACMELVVNDSATTISTIRLIMNANSHQLTIVSKTGEGTNYYKVHSDSIRGLLSPLPTFQATTVKKEFDKIGVCTKFQAKTHQNEFLVFTFEHEEIDLSPFEEFLKNDLIFSWIARNKQHSFPAQALTVSATGELVKSFQTLALEADFNQDIFEIPNGAIEIK